MYNPPTLHIITMEAHSMESIPNQQIDKEMVTTNPALLRRNLGQFLTPKHVADLMASFFYAHWSEVELLDPGAGRGDLTAALVRRLCVAERKPKRIGVTAYEVDGNVLEALHKTFDSCQEKCEQAGIVFSAKVLNEDFISASVSSLRGDLFSSQPTFFNAAIVNPPYKKLRSDSSARLWLRSIGIETSNFYSAFVALILRLLSEGGELVAITPRSFCNGPYFKPFRDEFLDTMSVRRLHLFESRSAAFGKDNVLQENVIVHAVKEPQRDDVILSSSSGRQDCVVTERRVQYRDVVRPADPERFIHVGISEPHARQSTALNGFEGTLGDLGLSVSTGRVVDFRARGFLRKRPDSNTAPLIYPCHFNGDIVAWPKEGSRKPNAIMIHDKTRESLVPAGIYVLVKRFSSKEERRRIVACVYDPDHIPSELVAFENHLNYFHIRGRGLPMPLARGLAAFLNSTVIDSYFRQFSGHTQVNATDLRILNYPPREALENLGRKIKYPISQIELDELIEKELL